MPGKDFAHILARHFQFIFAPFGLPLFHCNLDGLTAYLGDDQGVGCGISDRRGGALLGWAILTTVLRGIDVWVFAV